MSTVKMDESKCLNLLLDRCKFWTTDDLDLFEKMYLNYIDCGFFTEVDVRQIVDNDICNYCSIVKKGTRDFKKLLKLYQQGERDVSHETFKEYKVSYIEAVADDEERILIRY